MGFDINTITQASNIFNAIGQPIKHEIITVSSFQEAKEFKINKGDSYLLLDPNNDVLYIRECDSIGKNNTRVFSLKEVTEEYNKQSTSANISKADLEVLMQRIEKLENKRGVKNAVDEQSE